MVSLIIKLDSLLINTNKNKNKIIERDVARYIFDILCLYKIKNIIILTEDAKLTLEILKGSLKTNSSIMGNKSVTFKILIGVNLNSLREGNKLKYLNGVVISIPAIMSITRMMRNDFHTSFRNEEMDLVSN